MHHAFQTLIWDKIKTQAYLNMKSFIEELYYYNLVFKEVVLKLEDKVSTVRNFLIFCDIDL